MGDQKPVRGDRSAKVLYQPLCAKRCFLRIREWPKREERAGKNVAPRATLGDVNGPRGKARVFKTAWFSRAASKARIDDEVLCSAIRQVMLGQADVLGGGVYKKRLGKNLYRSIIVAKGGRFWVFAYLFAKQNKANIDERDLRDFRSLADLYAQKSESDLLKEILIGQLVEICDENLETI